MRRPFVLLSLILVLSGCVLETEEEARAGLAQWVYPGELLAFGADRRCVAAAFRLTGPLLRGTAMHSNIAERAVWHIGRGEAVAMQDPRMTPHDLSSAVMSNDLSRGLGLLTSVTGPRACMTDAMSRGVMSLILTPGATMIYDPQTYTVVIADFDRLLAVYLRSRY